MRIIVHTNTWKRSFLLRKDNCFAIWHWPIYLNGNWCDTHLTNSKKQFSNEKKRDRESNDRMGSVIICIGQCVCTDYMYVIGVQIEWLKT